MIDREVLESKLRFLREYMSDLKEYRESLLKIIFPEKRISASWSEHCTWHVSAALTSQHT